MPMNKNTNNYISQENCDYQVDTQRNTYCYASNTSKYFINYVENNFPQFANILRDKNHKYKSCYVMPCKYVGRAYYNSKDIYNEAVGRLFAYNNLKNKVDMAFRKRFATFFDDIHKNIQKITTQYSSYSNKLYDNRGYREQQLSDYFNEKI